MISPKDLLIETEWAENFSSAKTYNDSDDISLTEDRFFLTSGEKNEFNNLFNLEDEAEESTEFSKILDDLDSNRSSLSNKLPNFEINELLKRNSDPNVRSCIKQISMSGRILTQSTNNNIISPKVNRKLEFSKIPVRVSNPFNKNLEII